MVRKYIILFVILVCSIPLKAGKENICHQVLHRMFEKVDMVRTAQYSLHASERVTSKILQAQSFIKLQVSPRKIYFRNGTGIEILYNETTDKANALVNPNSFPYMNLKLDPYRSVMRNNQHHTIFELGFKHIADIIKRAVDNSETNFEKWFVYMGTYQYNNRDCHKIYFEYPHFRYVKYTVEKNETVRTIANKLGVGEYRIMQHNTNISYTDYIKEGRVISVPNMYASKTILYIDKELELPVYVKAFDDKGFYESYEFHDIQINLNFKSNEFDKGFKEYKF